MSGAILDTAVISWLFVVIGRGRTTRLERKAETRSRRTVNIAKASGLHCVSGEGRLRIVRQGAMTWPGQRPRTLTAMLLSLVLLRFLLYQSLPDSDNLILHFFPCSALRFRVSSHLLRDLLVYFQRLWAPRLDWLFLPWAYLSLG